VLEVVVLARLLQEDVHDHVAVVKRDPLGRGEALDVHGRDPEGLAHPALDLLGEGAHLTVVGPRGDDEGVEGVGEAPQVQNDGIATDLLVRGGEGCGDEGSDEVAGGTPRVGAAQ
jgi:hypothetical protein